MGSYSYNLARLLAACNQVVVFSGCAFINESISTEYEIINCGDLLTSVIVKCENNDDFKIKVVNVFETLHKCINFDIIESPEVGACALNIKLRNPQIPLVVKLHTPVSLLGHIMISNAPFLFKLKWFLKGLLKLDLNYTRNFFTRDIISDDEYQICKLANKIYSPSKELFSELSKIWNLTESDCIIDNYYPLKDTDVFHEIIETKKKSLNEKIVICFVGKQVFMKGADVIYHLINSLQKLNISFSFTIIADDIGDLFGNKYKDKYRNVILNNIDNVIIKNRMPNEKVLKHLEHSHLLVVPSLWENQPTVVWEGINSGCVVLANNIGGMKSMIVNRYTGFLINNNSVEEYVQCIKYLLKHKGEFQNIAELSFDKLTMRMNKDKLLQHILDIYKNTINS